MATARDDGVVYSVKELLAIQNEALGRIERKVDESVSKTSETLGKLDLRVTLIEKREDLEPRLRVLEDARTGEQGVKRWWDSFWARLVGVAAVAGAFWWLPGHFG